MAEANTGTGSTWLLFAILTVVTWGLYGIFLHSGQMAMGDSENGRYKAFLLVGVAYFLTAVLAPLAVLMIKGATWAFPAKGVWVSLFAGILGAVGAFGVILAFAYKGTPPVVMAIIFAGAPVVNALYSLYLHPPAGGWGSLKWQFILGLLMAASGGCLVMFFKPAPAPAHRPQPPLEASAAKR
jgi:drug/metabolite transporter (DMT)-like permease